MISYFFMDAVADDVDRAQFGRVCRLALAESSDDEKISSNRKMGSSRVRIDDPGQTDEIHGKFDLDPSRDLNEQVTAEKLESQKYLRVFPCLPIVHFYSLADKQGKFEYFFSLVVV